MIPNQQDDTLVFIYISFRFNLAKPRTYRTSLQHREKRDMFRVECSYDVEEKHFSQVYEIAFTCTSTASKSCNTKLQ